VGDGKGGALKKSSNATLVLVALGGALTVFRRVRLCADLCAEQLERDGGLG